MLLSGVPGFEPAIYLYRRFSPDGTRLAYLVSQGGSTDLWIYELQRGYKTRLTSGPITPYLCGVRIASS